MNLDDLGARPIDLDAIELTPEILALVPPELVRRFRMMPIAEHEGRITVAMSASTEIESLSALGEDFGGQVERAWVTEDSVNRKLERHYDT